MIPDIANMAFAFTVFSILGWILEVGYRSACARHYVNPGLLKGPYLIIYGTAAVMLMGAIHLVHEQHVVVKVFAYFFVTTGLELVCGLAFDAQDFFKVRLWDYSNKRFQFRGHICLKFSICWIALAFAFEYLVLPFYLGLASSVDPEIKGLFGATVLMFMVVDFVLGVRNRRWGTTKNCQKQNKP